MAEGRQSGGEHKMGNRALEGVVAEGEGEMMCLWV
jgi:hypothetical protein